VLVTADVVALKEVRLAPERARAGEARIEIVASSPVNYTSYQPDPGHFILEIPNVDLIALPAEVSLADAGLPPVRIVAVPSHGGGSHARIEFQGAGGLPARVIPEGAVLAVTLGTVPSETAGLILEEPPAAPRKEEPAPGPESPSPTPSAGPARLTAEPRALPLLPVASVAEPGRVAVEDASLVSGVVVEGSGGGASAAIVGDGAFQHSAFVLKNPDRLVVDLLGVVNRVPEKTFVVSADPLQRVRVAQFRTQPQKVVRVVFDLTRPVPHEVLADADGLRVFLGDAVKAPAQPLLAAVPPPGQVTLAPPAAAAPPRVIVALPAAAPASAETPAATAEAQDRPAPARAAAAAAHDPPTIPPLPEVEPRLVPTAPADLGRDVVLFDRADPAQQGREESGTLIPLGTTFQSQTIAGEKRRYRGEKISITFRDADVREVFFFFSDVMKMNVVLDPDVSGKIDIRLTQVPWDQAFQVILKNQGLDAVEEENVVRIAKTQKLRTEASERRALKQAQEQEVDPITFTRQLSYAKVSEALAVLQQVKSERGKIIADIRTNTLIISDIPIKRAAYENLLSALDYQTPQVSIEARIVEALRSFERSMGIDWSFTGLATPALGTQTNLQFPHRAEFKADVNLGNAGGAGVLGISLGNVLDSVTLDVQLDAFEADGKVRILSAPKVVTQNNQPATIEQGVQIPVVTTTATEIEVQYVPASLRLVVTPQITAEQTVIMKILVENNQPSATVSVGDTPGIVTERVDTQILVRSGTTAVIGGVYKLQETDNETGLPGLRRIPFFGWLFKNRSYEKNSSELIVFLTPKIVQNV